MQHVPVPHLYPGRSLMTQGGSRGYIDTRVETDGRVYLAETEVDEIVRVAQECFPGLVEARAGVEGLRERIDELTLEVDRLTGELAEAQAGKVVSVQELSRLLSPARS